MEKKILQGKRKRSPDDVGPELLDIKRYRTEPVSCTGRLVTKTFMTSGVDARRNEHTGQLWIFDKSNSNKLLGVADETHPQHAEKGFKMVRKKKGPGMERRTTVTFSYRSPDFTGPKIVWTREKIEKSKYFHIREPLIANSKAHRALPENRGHGRVDFYPHYGVERVVDQKFARAGPMQFASHCSALVFTGKDPFGASISIVIEGAEASRAIRVPRTWGTSRERYEEEALRLEQALSAKLVASIVNDYRMRRDLADLYDSTKGDTIAPPILRWEIAYRDGIDGYGYRGNNMDQAGLSFIIFYFSHTAYADKATTLLEKPSEWCTNKTTLPSDALEKGEYFRTRYNTSFRVYDDVSAMDRFMCTQGRRWGVWHSVLLEKCVDLTPARSHGRVTLTDREYRCHADDFKAVTKEDKCYVDGEWVLLADFTPDISIGTFDGEMRPPDSGAFPMPHRDCVLQYSYHTDTIMSKVNRKYLFSYGRLADEEEFAEHLDDLEEELANAKQKPVLRRNKHEGEDAEDEDMLDILRSLEVDDDNEDEDDTEACEQAMEDEEVLSFIMEEDTENCMPEDSSAVIGAVFEFDDEREMLEGFCEFIQVMQNDVITAWNAIFDVHYGMDRANVLGSPCFKQLGLVPGVPMSTRTSVIREKTRGVISMAGIIPMDMLYFMVNTKQYSAYNLNYVAGVIIGRKKATMPYEMINKFSRTPEGRRLIAIYCSEDSNLVVQIARKERPFITMLQECDQTNNDIATLINYGSERVIFRAIYAETKLTAPSNYGDGCRDVFLPVIPAERKKNYEGGTVFKPARGYLLNKEAKTLDLNSLYPSTTRENNLCATTMVNNYHSARLGLSEAAGHFMKRPNYEFNQEEMKLTYKDPIQYEAGFVSNNILVGVVPKFQSGLYHGRNEYKRAMNKMRARLRTMLEEGGHPEKELAAIRHEGNRFDAIQAIKKRTMNSIYGVVASPTFKLYALIIAMTITSCSRLCIMRTAIMQEQTFNRANGYPGDDKVIYGDTDSTMCTSEHAQHIVDFDYNTGEPVYETLSPRERHSVAVSFGPAMARIINAYYKRPSGLVGLGSQRRGSELVGGGYVNGAIETKFEKVYANPEFDVKKKYFGIFDDNKDAYLEVKGLGAVRRENPLRLRQHARQCMYLMAIGVPERAVELARKVLQDIHFGRIPMEDLAVSLKLSKPIDEYAKPNHAVFAARRYEAFTGALPQVGERFSAIVGKPLDGTNKISELYYPIDEVMAKNIPYNNTVYENKFFGLVWPVLKYLFDMDEKTTRNALFRGLSGNKVTNEQHNLFENRVIALNNTAARSTNTRDAERAKKIVNTMKRNSLLSHFTKKKTVRCALCKKSVPVDSISDNANYDSSESTNMFFCDSCEVQAKSGCVQDIEDLFAERSALSVSSVKARKECVTCQKSMGFKGRHVIEKMISECAAFTCQTYLKRGRIKTQKSHLSSRIASLPTAVRHARREAHAAAALEARRLQPAAAVNLEKRA